MTKENVDQGLVIVLGTLDVIYIGFCLYKTVHSYKIQGPCLRLLVVLWIGMLAFVL